MSDQTLQANIDTLARLQDLFGVLFIVMILITLLNILFYLALRHSPDSTFKFLIPVWQLKKKNVLLDVEDELGRPLGFVKIIVYKGERISRIFYKTKSDIGVFLPKGSYKITLEKFGYTNASTDEFTLTSEKMKFNLTLKKSEAISEAPSLYKIANYLAIINLVLSLTLAVSLFSFYSYLGLTLQLILFVLLVSAAYLSLVFYFSARGALALNFKHWPLPHTEIEVLTKKNESIDTLTTDKKGRMKMRIARGIYKFTPEEHSSRTVRINETGLAHLKIKF